MFLDKQKHQPAVKVSEKSQSEKGNFGHLCVAIETDAAFLSLFKSDFIKKWMDESWKDVLGGFQRAKTKSKFSYLCSYDGCDPAVQAAHTVPRSPTVLYLVVYQLVLVFVMYL